MLDRGGAAPDFLARGPRETYRLSASDELLYDNLKQGMGIDYDPTLFHMLDAIEHDFMLATTPDEDLGLFLSYLPELAPKRSMLDLSGPRLPATYTLGGKTYGRRCRCARRSSASTSGSIRRPPRTASTRSRP